MSNSSRELILHNVRKGLSGVSRPSSTIADDRDFAKEAREIRANLEESKVKLTEQFTAEVENVNATVINVKNADRILQSLVKLFTEKGVRSFAIWETPYLKELKLKERLKEEGWARGLGDWY